jgi:hypothetical protein
LHTILVRCYILTTVIPLIKLVPDLTHSLQHKQEQIAKTQKQNVLLAELDALDPPVQSVASGEDVDVLAEPSTLPLWRRVDRQFWWNEHLSKPFIDAGVPAVLSLECDHDLLLTH